MLPKVRMWQGKMIFCFRCYSSNFLILLNIAKKNLLRSDPVGVTFSIRLDNFDVYIRTNFLFIIDIR